MVAECCVNEVGLHHQVLIDEFGRQRESLGVNSCLAAPAIVFKADDVALAQVPARLNFKAHEESRPRQWPQAGARASTKD